MAYTTKETFGDLDVLYVADKKITPEMVHKLFGATQCYNNGDVISFSFMDFQIDLIHTEAHNFNYAYAYFSYNDIAGNLVGKLAHKFGLKHGHDGLWMPLRDENNVFDSVLITTSYASTCEFLDLDYDKYMDGFATLQEGFDWVAASKYFDPESYKLENLNHIAKIRDKKRATYHAFLEYCQNWVSSGNAPKTKFDKDKTKYFDEIFEFFPSARDGFEQATMKLAHQKYIKTKFNGDMVRELTGLDGKELGMFMLHLKSSSTLDKYNIVLMSDEKIKNHIMSEFAKKTGV